MSVWSRRITADAAFWGIVSGFVGNVVPKAADMLGLIDLPTWADPILIGAALSAVVILLVSRQGSVSATERSFQESLHRAPAGELAPAMRRRTGRWALCMVASGFVLSAVMYVLWALPYGAALQQPPSTLSGEEVLALCWGLPLVIGGLVLRGHLRRNASAVSANLALSRTDAD